MKKPKKDVTHEQVEDTYMEGTIDGNIDQVDQNGELVSHDGQKLADRLKEKK